MTSGPGGARDPAAIQAEIVALEQRLVSLREELAAAEGAPVARPTGDGRLRVLVADDAADIRELLQAIVDSQDDLELVGLASDAREAVTMAKESAPDVAVLDLAMPGGGGVQAALEILRDQPSTKVVAFTAHDTPDAQLEVMRAGAVSFLVKGASADEIMSTIRQAARF